MRSPLPYALSTVAAVVVALAGISCSSSTEMPPPKKEPAGPTTSLTYWKDVKPITESKCVTCHHDGGIAPFALVDYAHVKEHVDVIPDKVSKKEMPPWPPSKTCADYVADRSLDDAQIKTITDWIAGGAPEGKVADYVAPPEVAPLLSRVDRTLQMPEPYTPTQGPDDYRCFLLDWPETTTKFVTGFGVKPGVDAIVHHAIAFYAPKDQVADYQKLDDAESGPGWTCFGGPGSNKAAWISGWAPGALGTDFPAGTGIRMEPGSKIVLQVHYNILKAKAAPDQTTLSIKLDDHVDKEAMVLKWIDYHWLPGLGNTMAIPARAADATHSYVADADFLLNAESGGAMTAKKPFTVWSAGLHMHTRGAKGTLSIARADGTSECALDIEHWNFHWQGSFGFTAPKQVNPGDKLGIECHWDNATGNTDLHWGETTEDEMCLGVFYVTQ
ncbi:MAG: hypothetical protein NVS3B10_22290 [Polyangiales bacterium]